MVFIWFALHGDQGQTQNNVAKVTGLEAFQSGSGELSGPSVIIRRRRKQFVCQFHRCWFQSALIVVVCTSKHYHDALVV